MMKSSMKLINYERITLTYTIVENLGQPVDSKLSTLLRSFINYSIRERLSVVNFVVEQWTVSRV